jgi:hypothetical protein
VLTRSILIFAIALLAGCAGTNSQTVTDEAPVTEEAPTASKERCCAQCGNAASQDPAGRDISMNACTGYIGYVVNGKAPLDASCAAWFEAHPHSVAECR